MVTSPLNSASFPPVENLSNRNSSSAAAAHYGEALRHGGGEERRRGGGEGKREVRMNAKLYNKLPCRLVLSIFTPLTPDHGGAAALNARRGYRIKIVPCRGCCKNRDDSYDSDPPPPLYPCSGLGEASGGHLRLCHDLVQRRAA